MKAKRTFWPTVGAGFVFFLVLRDLAFWEAWTLVELVLLAGVLLLLLGWKLPHYAV